MAIVLRLVAGGALAAVAAGGVFLSDAVQRRSAQRLEDIRQGRTTAEAAQTEALQRKLEGPVGDQQFAHDLRQDVQAFGVQGVTLDDVRQPNSYFAEIEAPVTLAPGKRWRSKRVRVKASVEKVLFQQRGAQVSARHAVATVTNIGDKPIGYFIRVRSAKSGNCKVRGARMNNAMALMPGESAEIVVCAGAGGIRIERLELLQVTALGYAYLSKLSPLTVGYDGVTAGAHRPPRPITQCTEMPSAQIAGYLKGGDATWADVADFYSRHNCERQQFFVGYHRASAPVAVLPQRPG